MSEYINIYYNSETYNRINPDIFMIVNKDNNIYTYITKNTDYIITFIYKKYTIIVNY